ncbi:hypothetical protein ACTXON_04375 [Brachybacterium alimentarium]|uniref:hypothetical protein n=1 Tax=Brachybacterium alimentarium TaxID=47845 RepID=UPI0031D97B94
MSTLTFLLILLTALLTLATMISIHLTVVTARNKSIPRWIFVLGGLDLVLATLAVFSLV